ncbi:MAG: hypothetical protein AB1758_26195, partial [Candidatus Eremiobacterota bacterium]
MNDLILHNSLTGTGHLNRVTLRSNGQPSAEIADRVEWGTGPQVKVPRSGAELVLAANPTVTAPVEAAGAPPVETPQAEDLTPERSGPQGWKKVGLMAALGLTVGAGLLGNVATAQAAPASQVATQQQTRDLTPVRVSSVDQVVQQFDAEHQIYVVGNPGINGQQFSQQDYQRFQEVLRNHPNVYIVLVQNTSDVITEGGQTYIKDDWTLSRGIGNSPEFQGVVNPQTGEREGVVFMYYGNVTGQANDLVGGKGRGLFMRSEALPDRLGVGEDNFMSETGEPRELFNLFVNAFANEGKDLPGSLEVVMNRINGTIANHVQQTVGNAQSQVSAAEAAVNGVAPKVQAFQRNHGTGGELGSPDLSGWQNQLAQARQALANKDFASATSISQNLVSTIRTYEQAIANYEQAPGIAQEVQAQLDQVQADLGKLENNGAAQSARTHYEAARQSLQQFQTAYEAKDTEFFQHLQTARTEAGQAAKDVQESKSDAAFKDNAIKIGTATVIIALLATGFIMNRIAAKKGKAAKAEYEAALAEIGQKSRELLELMSQSDYHTVANYTGKTKALADELMQNTMEALTLVGGANKFLAEADALIKGRGVAGKLQNTFLSGNYNQAIGLLTDEST